jgi:hypothetical protein
VPSDEFDAFGESLGLEPEISVSRLCFLSIMERTPVVEQAWVWLTSTSRRQC